MKEFKKVTSKENSLIKFTSDLQRSAKKRQENGLFVLEGLRICKDAFDNGIMFDKLIICDTVYEKFQREIADFSKASNECILMTEALFKKISETDSPQGIMAIAKKPEPKCDIKQNGYYIALENLQDPSNLGAIARSCEALGVDGIFISKNSCDPYSPKSLRASMGTLLRLPVFVLEDFSRELKKTGLKSFACVVDSTALPISKADFTAGSVVLIGNEANGLADDTVAACDYAVTIPMKGRAESLNASVAGAIAVWEMMK